MPWWFWSEDRQWSSSRLLKNWDNSQQLSWYLEVRGEDVGAGSIRLGEMLIKGSMNGVLAISITNIE